VSLPFVTSPLAALARWNQGPAGDPALQDYESYWRSRGQAVSDAVDRQGTPHLRMFDALGRRKDEILLPPEYWALLQRGYQAGVVWRVFAERTVLPFCRLGHVTSFFDPGLFCPFTVSLATAVVLDKYGAPEVKARYLPPLLDRERAWQGATWMTEAGGGSDLGATVETVARAEADGSWRLTGDKYFASNAGAELAVVAARPDGAPSGPRGLALFLVPRDRPDGALNYTIRRLKDKIATRSVPTGEVELRSSLAYLLGPANQGIYLVLEVLNVSRVANSIASVALAQRAIADAQAFASSRRAFGRPIAEHPLLARQFADRVRDLEIAAALAWDAACRLDRVWQERPPYSSEYDLFRLVAHLAKYWTADNAVATARWAMEVLAGAGTLAENRVERWLREAMILAIWEGTPHRHILDGLEVMARKGAHRHLLDRLAGSAPEPALAAWRSRIESHLRLPEAKREGEAEALFRELARFTGESLARH
jgi:alkylation response protein AidB-like acyl-CoA dehydrogenase